MADADVKFSRAELDLLRQWFNAVEDSNPLYLEEADRILAQRIHAALGARMANKSLPKARHAGITTAR